MDRVFGSYLEPEYARAERAGTVPGNVRVIEFYLAPGALLGAAHAQRNYLSANYTQVARELLPRGVNVIAHLVARRSVGGQMQLSLGSNPDITADLLPQVEAARSAGRDIVLLAETHAQMPFMGGHAQVDPQIFDFVLDHPRYDYDLFGPPNASLGDVDHAIGMHASALVRDGGTLQVGIGELGDALVYALLLRHQQTAAWRSALAGLGPGTAPSLVESTGGDGAFTAGLFASSEMFVDGLLELYRAGILRRRAYDCLVLERALQAGQSERFGPQMLEALLAAGAGPELDEATFRMLRWHGVFREDSEYRGGRMRMRGGEWIAADLGDARARRQIAEECLGRALRNGQVLHAGFFLGPRGFYAALRDLPEDERAQFSMRGVGYVNQLYGEDQELRILQRRDMRCINTAMMVTLLGAAVSDALQDGQVVSGVGGQYNFVAMAHALNGARSILCVRATRTHQGRTSSNVRWNYGHTTIPRHLRDIVITEYGIADLRGRTDEEVIMAMLNVADSRFQEELLARAKAAGKLRGDYRIPEQFRDNLPGRLARGLDGLRARGFFSEYPFGTDLTAEEIALARALRFLGAHTHGAGARLRMVAAALLGGSARPHHAAALQRMGLEQPRGLAQLIQQRLVVRALEATAPPREASGA